MSISAANKISFSSGDDLSSYATSSWSPTNGRIYYATVVADGAPSTATIPTLSGNGMTWTQIHSEPAGAGERVWTTFRALASASSTGATTASFSSNTQTACIIIIDELAGVKQGNNGADATVQAVEATGTGTTASATLSAFGDATNHATYYSGFVAKISFAATPEAGFTELADIGQGAIGATTGWRLGQDTTPSFTWTGSSPWVIMGVEVADPDSDTNNLLTGLLV